MGTDRRVGTDHGLDTDQGPTYVHINITNRFNGFMRDNHKDMCTLTCSFTVRQYCNSCISIFIDIICAVSVDTPVRHTQYELDEEL